mgnify:CR=1 FL=1
MKIFILIASSENMTGGKAYKPDDVINAYNGKTIEVINTDAEGRLVLADALHYTNTKFKPKFIVDLVNEKMFFTQLSTQGRQRQAAQYVGG